MWRRVAARAWDVCLGHLGSLNRPFGRTSLKSCGRRWVATISVDPAAGLADQPAKVAVWGLPPLEEVTLRALAVNEEGILFDSCAHYQANKQGEVDLSKDPSKGGDYMGLEPMGLFWSLSPAAMENPYQRLEPRKVKGPMKVEMSVHRGYSQPGAIPGQLLAKTNVERRFILPEVRRIRVKDGAVRGSLFLPPAA